MTRIQSLLQQLDDVEQMMRCRINMLETLNDFHLYRQIETVVQKIRLVEKKMFKKNERSYSASVSPQSLVK